MCTEVLGGKEYICGRWNGGSGYEKETKGIRKLRLCSSYRTQDLRLSCNDEHVGTLAAFFLFFQDIYAESFSS